MESLRKSLEALAEDVEELVGEEKKQFVDRLMEIFTQEFDLEEEE